MIILEHETEGTSARALSLFAAKAQRAVGLRGEVNIRIASSRELQELNRRFRKKNQPTDVLSFPSETPKLAGDIAISGEIAAANAAEMGHSPQTELKVLILHGLLHLAGYDHETDDGEMRTRETSLRRKLGLPVGLIERAHASLRKGPRWPKVIRQVCRLQAAEASGDEPAVSHPSGGFDGVAGPGVLRGPALRRDGKVLGAGVPGEHRRLRTSRRAQAACEPRTGCALDGGADPDVHGQHWRAYRLRAVHGKALGRAGPGAGGGESHLHHRHLQPFAAVSIFRAHPGRVAGAMGPGFADAHLSCRAGDPDPQLRIVGRIALQGAYRTAARAPVRGRGRADRSRSGRGHSGGERPRSYPVGRRIRRQDGARGDDAPARDRRRPHQHDHRGIYRAGEEAPLFAHTGV